FFAIKKFMPYRQLQQFCTIDYDTDMTLVASIHAGECETIVGMAMYARDDKTGLGEVACVIADDYQGRGVGTALMRHLTQIAVSRQLKGFTADVLSDNVAMMRVFRHSGYPVESVVRGDTTSLRIPFGRSRQ